MVASRDWLDAVYHSSSSFDDYARHFSVCNPIYCFINLFFFFGEVTNDERERSAKERTKKYTMYKKLYYICVKKKKQILVHEYS